MSVKIIDKSFMRNYIDRCFIIKENDKLSMEISLEHPGCYFNRAFVIIRYSLDNFNIISKFINSPFGFISEEDWKKFESICLEFYR